MEHCQACRERGALRCAAIWKFDDAILQALRVSDGSVRRRRQCQITIADFIAGLCTHQGTSDALHGLGVDTVALASDVQRHSIGQSSAPIHGAHVVLSDPLNALLVAAEDTAALAGASSVRIDSLAATLISNAAHDPAAQTFANHAHAIARYTQQVSAANSARSSTRYGVVQPVHPRVGMYGGHSTHRAARETNEYDSVRGANFGHTSDIAPQTVSDNAVATTGSQARGRALYGERPTGAAELTVGAVRDTRNRGAHRNAGLHRGDNAVVGEQRYDNIATFDRDRSVRATTSSAYTSSRGDGDRGSGVSSDTRREPGGRQNTWERRSFDQMERLIAEQGQRLERLERSLNQKSRKRLRLKNFKFRKRKTQDRSESWSRTQDTGTTRSRYYPHTGAHGLQWRDLSQRSSGTAGSGRKQNRESTTDRDRLATVREDTTVRSEKRFYLSLDDDLVEAPSIGPKTAARFEAIGVMTVRDLMDLDVEETADKLNVRHITATVLTDWQDQARLVCTVPWLRGTHAQLLVGADYRTAHDIATADLGEVLAGILRFSATNAGERVLRTNPPPERDKVATWLGNAKQADVSRVA